MNIVLSILAVIFIFLLCNYLYRKIKGIPNKPVKEIWNEYKQEMQKIDEVHKQRMQKIDENFEKEKERKKDLKFNKFQTTSHEIFTIKTPENEDVEVELACTAGLIQTSQIDYGEFVRKEFLYKCFPVTWNDFLKLNKYEKILAYTVKDCNDIGLLKEVYEQMFKYLKWQSELPEYLKKDIRSRKRYLHEFSNPVQIKSKLSLKAYRYYINFFLNEIPEGSYFPMQIMHRGDELSEALYNTYFLKDDESIDMYYPPNFYGDTSSFDIVEPRFFNSREYYKNYKPFNRFDLKPHSDYDFNIPKYIVKHYLDMKTIVKEDEHHKRIFC
ncbi:hypothetical protein H9O11_000190 [Campylobacter jejuni]|nr:hypothetical protein [Campylobacter jejuni]